VDKEISMIELLSRFFPDPRVIGSGVPILSHPTAT